MRLRLDDPSESAVFKWPLFFFCCNSVGGAAGGLRLEHTGVRANPTGHLKEGKKIPEISSSKHIMSIETNIVYPTYCPAYAIEILTHVIKQTEPLSEHWWPCLIADMSTMRSPPCPDRGHDFKFALDTVDELMSPPPPPPVHQFVTFASVNTSPFSLIACAFERSKAEGTWLNLVGLQMWIK